MALSKQITTALPIVGETVVDAYIKVESYSGDKDNTNALVVYKKEASNGEFIRSDVYSFNLDLNGSNVVAQAYEHLKTLPEFADAVDC